MSGSTLERFVAALEANTKALEDNTRAQRELKLVLLEDQSGGQDPDAEAAFYLDGTPRGD